ncbi:MAG: lytic transglycosylase domain-containing protein [Saccharofermentanales bacterium]
METLKPPPIILAITAASILGIFSAYTLQCQPETQIQNTVTIKPAQPVDHVAIEWIRKYNPALSEAQAQEMYSYVEQTIARYKADPIYQKGAAKLITPKLFLALILRESGAKWQSISDHGAIGLCQVMPLHVKDLHRAGVIESPEVEELLEAEANIRAGVHVLMVYAKGVDSITRALSRYNAGPSRERAGRGYARAVLKLYEDIGG